MSDKIAYVAMATDVFHSGHINIINQAAKYGKVVVGVLTDEAVATYKRPPLLDTEERMRIAGSFKNVDRVVIQEHLDDAQTLRKIKPDYVVHGDDWRTGYMQVVRERIIALLSEWGGELIEVPYSHNLSADRLSRQLSGALSTPDQRLGKLRRLLQLKPFIRAIDVSNGLTGIIAENVRIMDESTLKVKEFDAMWISSLCDSSFKGKPDIELVDLTSRISTINEVMEVTTKPVILDGDTGGKIEHFPFHVKTLERLGVSAVIIEDKTGLKQNSLFGTDVQQVLDAPADFAAKIAAGKRAQSTKEFMIIARLESLIAGLPVEDAMMRAKIYIEAGADAVMIHSREKSGDDVFAFLKLFRAFSSDIPVVVVPTAYNRITEDELHAGGANIIIYANFLLRSAYPAMVRTAESILSYGRSLEAADEFCMSVNDVLTFI